MSIYLPSYPQQGLVPDPRRCPLDIVSKWNKKGPYTEMDFNGPLSMSLFKIKTLSSYYTNEGTVKEGNRQEGIKLAQIVFQLLEDLNYGCRYQETGRVK